MSSGGHLYSVRFSAGKYVALNRDVLGVCEFRGGNKRKQVKTSEAKSDEDNSYLLCPLCSLPELLAEGVTASGAVSWTHSPSFGRLTAVVGNLIYYIFLQTKIKIQTINDTKNSDHKCLRILKWHSQAIINRQNKLLFHSNVYSFNEQVTKSLKSYKTAENIHTISIVKGPFIDKPQFDSFTTFFVWDKNEI